jgi:hypothetical protein
MTDAERIADLPWFQRRRLMWIDEMLDIYGFINRDHIIRKFEISMPQASLDLTKYQDRFPNRCTYDKSTKRYLRWKS